MDDLEQKMRDIAQQVHDENSTSDQFGVSQTPFHTHNGADSQRINFKNIANRSEFINFDLPGSQGQTTNNWGVIFTAPYACAVIGITEVHQTAESTATTMTVQLEKLSGTTASGSGIALLVTPFNLKSTANTVQTGTLNTTSANTGLTAFNLVTGDRLGLALTTTGSAPATLIGVNIIIQLSY
jgi:hypothetical protein